MYVIYISFSLSMHTDGYLGWPYNLAIVKSADVNMSMHVHMYADSDSFVSLHFLCVYDWVSRGD